MRGTAPLRLALRVVSEEPGPSLLGLSSAERNRRIVRRATAPAARPESALPTLTIPAGAVITPALVAALPPPNGTAHLIWAPDRPPIVWQSADPPASSVPSAHELPDGLVLDVSTAAARRRAAWRLLRASGKPTDGWLSRHVHRRISRVFSYALLRLGLSADVATLLAFVVGLAAAWLMAQTTHATMIAGAAMFWFASVADGIDGEMARLTLSESTRGEHLDTIVDDATYAAGFIGVMVGWWRQGIGRLGIATGAAVAIGLPVMLLWAMRFVRNASGDRVDTKLIEFGVADAAAATGAPALRIASTVFVLFRREVVALAFFVAALTTGRRALYPALIGSGLAIVAATVVTYRREIERAIRARASGARAQPFERAAAATRR